MRAAFLLLPLALLAACSVDHRADGKRMAEDPDLDAVRSGFPNAAEQTFAATDALPGLRRGHTTTSDTCVVDSDTGEFSETIWRLTCVWGTTRYYAFDGDFTAHTKAMSDALVAAGWEDSKPITPNAPEVVHRRHFGGQHWTVTLSWAESAQLPASLPEQPSGDHVRREVTESDNEELYRELTSTNRYVLVVSMRTHYLFTKID